MIDRNKRDICGLRLEYKIKYALCTIVEVRKMSYVINAYAIIMFSRVLCEMCHKKK